MDPCDKDILETGSAIVALNACMERAEEWVRAVAKDSGQQVDWHYSGGIANVLYLGDYDKVLASMKKLEPELAVRTPIDPVRRCRCRTSPNGSPSDQTTHEPGRVMNYFPRR